MSDLISRSDLIAKIENDIKDTENYMVLFSSNRVALSSQLNTLKTYKAIIKNQPTAYDVEKVVAELEEKSDFFGTPSMGSSQKFGYCMGIEDAIDIVKRGGIE